MTLVVAGAAVTVVGGGATVGLGTAVVSKSPAVANLVRPAVKTVVNQIVKTAPKVIPRVINKIIDGAQDDKNKKPSDGIKFGSDSKPVQKLKNEMDKRGWTKESVIATVDSPYTTRVSKNMATENPATAYYNKQGGYVVIDDVTKEVVQVSDNLNPGTWHPDPNIVNPYLP